MSRQNSPTSPVLNDRIDPTNMVTQEDHHRLQRDVQDTHNKMGDHIASIAVDLKEFKRDMTSSIDEIKAMLHIITSPTMTLTSIHIIVMAKSLKTIPQNERGATT